MYITAVRSLLIPPIFIGLSYQQQVNFTNKQGQRVSNQYLFALSGCDDGLLSQAPNKQLESHTYINTHVCAVKNSTFMSMINSYF